MINYSPIDYLKIDIANHWGLGNDQFEDRIAWVNQTDENPGLLEKIAPDAKDYFRYTAALMAYRDSLMGKPTGYVVGLDASASGIAIMGAVIGCQTTAKNTGIIGSHKQDIYVICTDVMSKLLGSKVTVERKKVKAALMTMYYGSQAKPKEIFGEGTDEYLAFYEASEIVAPGANILKDTLLASWQPYALSHSWVMPDGFHVYIPVLHPMTKKIEIDELNHTSIIMKYTDNIGSESGLSLVANFTHSIDAYILRQVVNRADFDVLVIHDEYLCHPNNTNQLRSIMIDVMSDLADSNIMNDILSQINGYPVHIPKLSQNLGHLIRSSEYIIS